MTICLVTSRLRREPVEQARRAVEAGIDLIQIRERDLDAAALGEIVRAVVAAVRAAGSRTRVVVNERADVAMACGADGVHLRADSVAAGAVRRMVRPGFLIGRSVHSAEEARAAGPVDYLIAGTVFPSESKAKDAAVIGLDGLAAIVRASPAPVLAIGGMMPDRSAAVASAGAAGIAAIGLFAGAGSLAQTVDSLRMRFDTVKTAP